MRSSLSIILLALGCDRSEPAPSAKAAPAAATSPSAPAAAASCLGAEVEAALVDGCVDSPVSDARALAAAKWPATHRGSLDGVPIEVSATGAQLHGEPLAEGTLRRALSDRRTFGKPDDPAFVLAIERDAKLVDVQAVLETLAAADASEGVLLYGSATLPKTPAALHPEVHARLTATIEGLPPSDRAMTAARELERLVAPCPAVKDAFQSMATDDPTHGCAKLMHAVVAAVSGCNCPSWTPELITWLQVVNGPAGAPRVHADDVRLTPASPTEASKAATWATLVEGRTAPIATLWLELGG